ncbi:MAG: hypothetical protein H0W73_20225 [Bacteroidetes bacterium]|nr:hypothetical protein [Bacteroidota bacterium]
MRFHLFSILLVNLFLLNSCKKHVPSDAAFFIKPTLISVKTTTATPNQGSGTHKITDLWLYVDGKFQGVYPAGNLLPVISKGENVKINIFGGIKNNGISNTRLYWPFYDFITIDTLVPNGKVIELPLTFKYMASTTFAWLENFDSNGVTLVKSSDTENHTDTTWKQAAPADCFEGKSAEIGLTGAGKQAFLESSIAYPMPMGSSNVYLEINYKCNERFEVGIVSGVTSKSTLFVSPSDTWNKIYIQLADAVNRTPYSTNQKVYFRLVSSTETPYPKMFLDNIKLVYL